MKMMDEAVPVDVESGWLIVGDGEVGMLGGLGAPATSVEVGNALMAVCSDSGEAVISPMEIVLVSTTVDGCLDDTTGDLARI